MRIFPVVFYNMINNEKLSQRLTREEVVINVITSTIKYIIQPLKIKIRLGSMEKLMI